MGTVIAQDGEEFPEQQVHPSTIPNLIASLKRMPGKYVVALLTCKREREDFVLYPEEPYFLSKPVGFYVLFSKGLDETVQKYNQAMEKLNGKKLFLTLLGNYVNVDAL